MSERTSSVDPVKIALAIGAIYVVTNYVLPFFNLAGEGLKKAQDVGKQAVDAYWDRKDRRWNAEVFYNSGTPVQLIDGAGVRLESLQTALLDKKQGVFLYQGRLYKLSADGKQARLAPQETRITLTLAGKRDTYVQGPYRVQVIAS